MDLDNYNLEYSSDPNLTSHVSDLAGQTNAGIANQYGSGISQARGLLAAPEHFNSGIAYGDKATTDAIRSRYSQPYQREEKKLQLDNLRGAAQDHIRQLTVASQAAGQEVEMNKQKAIFKNKVEQANRKARGAVLGNVLGIVGGVVGGIYGGPAGAGAGYAAGSGIGQMAGES